MTLVTRYTADSANRALPYVRRIVQDIVDAYARWQEIMREVDALGAGTPSEADRARLTGCEREVQRLAADIDGCLGELAAIGVQCKGYDVGLVDFPTEIDGRPAYLCWKLGEPAVAHWHDETSGFAGRQPLDPQAVG